ARVVQNPGYPNCCDIVSGFEIFPALNLTPDQEVHAVCRHSQCPLFAFIPSLTKITDAPFASIPSSVGYATDVAGNLRRRRPWRSCRRFCDKNGVCIRTESVNCHWNLCRTGGLEFSLGPRPDTGRPKGIADPRLQTGLAVSG